MQTRLNVVGYHSQFPQFEVYCEIPTYDGSKKECWFSYLGSGVGIERNCHDMFNVYAKTDKMCDIFNKVFGTDFLFNVISPSEQLKKVIKYMLKENIILFPNVRIID